MQSSEVYNIIWSILKNKKSKFQKSLLLLVNTLNSQEKAVRGGGGSEASRTTTTSIGMSADLIELVFILMNQMDN